MVLFLSGGKYDYCMTKDPSPRAASRLIPAVADGNRRAQLRSVKSG